MVEKFLKDIATAAIVFVKGWKTFFLPAEPFYFAYDFTLTANQSLNNQTLDLRLPYDLYVYAVGRGSTGLFRFLLKGSGGGVFFGNTTIRSDSMWGTTAPMFMLRRPFKIESKSSLVVDLQDLSGAGNTGQIILWGWKSASQYSAPQEDSQ